MCVCGGGGGGGDSECFNWCKPFALFYRANIYFVSVRELTSYMYSTSCAYQACLVAYWTKSYIRQVCISDQLDWMSD